MRSLHVVTTDARRGAETFAVELTTELRASGHDARVVALTGSLNREVHAIRCLGPSRRSPATLRELRRLAAAVDVVVAHGSSTLEACALGLAGSGVPFVYRTIGDPAYWQTSAWRRRVAGMLLRRAAREVVLWPGAADQLTDRYRIPSERIDVIPNAVQGDRFALATDEVRRHARRRFGVAPDNVCLAFVGALSPEKNVEAIVQAAADLDGIVVLVAGDGHERTRLEHLAGMLPPDRVIFLGPVDHPGDIYAAADLLLLPSHSEGMPAVLIEAALVGTPTVATAVGSVPAMIDDGVTGFLTPSGDPATLAERIQAVLPRAREVGLCASRAFRGRYTIEKIAPLWATSLERARGA